VCHPRKLVKTVRPGWLRGFHFRHPQIVLSTACCKKRSIVA
jgi:hypothetical protein